jgi:hypothetical protein
LSALTVDTVCVAVAVAFDFNAVPLLTLPVVQDRKWIKKASLFEPQASFEAFPFFVLHNWEAEGQWQRGRLSLLTFFGEAKKVSGCRATPDLLTMSLCEGQYGSKYAVTRSRKVD